MVVEGSNHFICFYLGFLQMDDSHKSLIRDHSIIPSLLSGQGKVTASADTGHFRSSTHPIKKDEEERRDGRLSAPPVNLFVTKVTMAASNVQTSPPVVSETRDIKVGCLTI